MTSERFDEFGHDVYGYYNDVPHTSIDLNINEWHEAVQQVLEYTLGPPVAWRYEGGTLDLWGEQLDESLLSKIADECNEIERQHADDRMYNAAEAARRAAARVVRAEVHPPGEKIIT